MDLVAANAVLCIRQQPDRAEPLVERYRTVLENRADFDRKLPLLVFVLALPRLAGAEKRNLFLAATWAAHDPIRPAQGHHELKGVVPLGEIANRVKEGLGIGVGCVLHTPYTLIASEFPEPSMLLPGP